MRKPQVFLFDEPLSNLDAKLRVQMRSEIKQLHQRLKTTTVYVTHDQIEAMTMADRIVVMNRGVVEQVGRPKELFDYPANRFVANFIGSPAMNFIEGKLERCGAGAELVTDSGYRLPLDAAPASEDGVRVIYGVRPEHLQLVTEGGVGCTVSVVEDTGSETIVLAKLGSEPITLLLRERMEVTPGDTIRIAPRPGTAHFFCPRSEKRLAVA